MNDNKLKKYVKIVGIVGRDYTFVYVACPNK